MKWLLVSALPLLLCGGMCLGGMALAAVGLRRSKTSCHDAPNEPAGEDAPVSAPQ